MKSPKDENWPNRFPCIQSHQFLNPGSLLFKPDLTHSLKFFKILLLGIVFHVLLSHVILSDKMKKFQIQLQYLKNGPTAICKSGGERWSLTEMRCNVVQLTYIFTFNLKKHYINQLHMADKIYATHVTDYSKRILTISYL